MPEKGGGRQRKTKGLCFWRVGPNIALVFFSSLRLQNHAPFMGRRPEGAATRLVCGVAVAAFVLGRLTAPCAPTAGAMV